MAKWGGTIWRSYTEIIQVHKPNGALGNRIVEKGKASSHIVPFLCIDIYIYLI